MKTLKYLMLTMLPAFFAPWSEIKAESPAEILEARQKELKGVDFEMFSKEITPEEREYLEFLYAYMPLADITDHDTRYFLENVRTSLKARKEMPWGKDIPEREFKYFVVPVRVNDEPLDNHRQIFYEELKERLKGKTIEEAILEVNHWCHEKATYQPSDGRTRSPLQTIGAAIGRCGEESTFTVSALRAVGIPARQVYTPRWAHTDDNHAWVEAYANGKWHFLGACEPEAVLDLGWFNAPASRGILMNTRVLGQYRGPEEILVDLPDYTDINVTSNYAPTGKLTVDVLNPDGTPAENAQVSFRVYNYSEFYPLATRRYRKGEPASLEGGKGDLLVWASDGKNYGFRKASVGKDSHITIKLGVDGFEQGKNQIDIDVIPPTGINNLPAVPEELTAMNNRRKALEDSIRHAYEASFITPAEAEELAKSLGLDTERVSKIMKDSRGNGKTLKEFLKDHPTEGALNLLEVISQKDRGDVRREVLEDHFKASGTEDVEYVLNPRVDNEQLTAFRSMFVSNFTPEEQASFKASPAKWVKWVEENIEIVPDWYPARVRMTPEGVNRTRKANSRSRDIYFVCGARSFGIPARIDPVSNKTQWREGKEGEWNDVFIGGTDAESAPSCKGLLKLDYTCESHIDDPKYYSHFSLSKIAGGETQLLGFDDFASWKEEFSKKPIELDCGEYMLVTGQRLANGGVLARLTRFEIKSGETTNVDMTIRQNAEEVQVIGNFNSENLYSPDGKEKKSILSTTGRGYYVIGIVSPLEEPTIHALNDLSQSKAGLDKEGRPILLLTQNEASLEKLKKAVGEKDMPENLNIGIDPEGTILKELSENLKLTPKSLPVIVVADTFNRVVYWVEGYSVGLGERLREILHKIKE